MSFNIPQLQNPSVMKHDFSKNPQVNIERSAFRRSHGVKTAFNAGYLIPIYADEALPGDTFKLNLSSVSRLVTPWVPVMDNMYLDTFFFAVPNRLVWDNFQRFMGERTPDPDSSIDFVVPQIWMGANPVVVETLADYFGIPIGVNNLKFNSLHFRAYNLIWNEWFRDQNLQDSVLVDKDAGPDAIGDYVLLKRGKRHDYFTSCLPWPQKGTAVDLPLGSSAPVKTGIDRIFTVAETPLNIWDPSDGTYMAGSNSLAINAGRLRVGGVPSSLTEDGAPSNLWADLSGATASTINDLREAFQLQKLMERDARGGTRYTEIIRSHFSVTSPDARLQRPEYLGGGTKRINIEPVPSTAEISQSIGYLGATAYCNQSGHGFTKSFVEHCVIIGLACVRCDLTYQTGMNRMWSRQTKYDYYWPALAHLGEQAVLNQEIYVQGTSVDQDVFGYQERWAEYRYHPSMITGKLRSKSLSSLDIWHLAQDFGAVLPELGPAFIEENPPLDRILTSADEPEIKMDCYFDVVTTRPMPMYSVPGLIDHF